MTKYIKISDGTYPYTFAQLRKDNPGVSYPRTPRDENLASWGVDVVAEVARPAYDPAKNIVEGQPTESNGVWTQVWDQPDATAEQIARRQADAKNLAEQAEIKLDNFVGTFIGMTPAEVSAYIGANVTDLASAKNVLNKLALIVLPLAKREFKD